MTNIPKLLASTALYFYDALHLKNFACGSLRILGVHCTLLRCCGTLQVAGLLGTLVATQNPHNACTSLKTTLALENTTILEAEHIAAGTDISTPGSCQSTASSTVGVCRVYAVVNTTEESAVHFEVWLPDTWYGRFLAVGNGGLGGCIDYLNLDYGSTLHFATVGSDNGHDGNSGVVFLDRPEVINDFAFRAIHVEAILGKQIVEAYYNRTHDKSYYLGCSTGGRQGMQSALLFPEDFDGIVAGAPATDFNHLLGWLGMIGRYIGAPNPNTSKSFIPASLWPVISQEILKQCDGLDGVEDGIVTEPDECIFQPEALLCNATRADESSCITAAQVDALRQVYEPMFGTKGELIYPRYDPGAEADGNFKALLSGAFFPLTHDWTSYTIYNDSNHSFDNYNVAEIDFTDTINPGGIATWNGDMSAFHDRGGKLITYHGRRDPLIASSNSKRMYNLISSTLSLPTLDDFYRLFLVPGMDHCLLGPGAWAIGQYGIESNAVNDTAHNVLLALVDWVEGGDAPDVIIGSTVGGNMTQREHCRYPQQSFFNGTTFICQE